MARRVKPLALEQRFGTAGWVELPAWAPWWPTPFAAARGLIDRELPVDGHCPRPEALESIDVGGGLR